MIIKQSVVDVLMFLFEQYLGDENDSEVAEERDVMQSHLQEMGFHHREINQAFDWLEDLATLQDQDYDYTLDARSIRIYSPEERNLLNNECIGFITYLEQSGVLNAPMRELILDRVIALNHALDIEQLKWIVLIVLHTHPAEEDAYNWMESFVFDESDGVIQ